MIVMILFLSKLTLDCSGWLSVHIFPSFPWQNSININFRWSQAEESTFLSNTKPLNYDIKINSSKFNNDPYLKGNSVKDQIAMITNPFDFSTFLCAFFLLLNGFEGTRRSALCQPLYCTAASLFYTSKLLLSSGEFFLLITLKHQTKRNNNPSDATARTNRIKYVHVEQKHTKDEKKNWNICWTQIADAFEFLNFSAVAVYLPFWTRLYSLLHFYYDVPLSFCWLNILSVNLCLKGFISMFKHS